MSGRRYAEELKVEADRQVTDPGYSVPDVAQLKLKGLVTNEKDYIMSPALVIYINNSTITHKDDSA